MMIGNIQTKEIDKASADYGEIRLAQNLSVNRFTAGPRDKAIRLFNTYDIEVAFEAGVEFALSKLIAQTQ